MKKLTKTIANRCLLTAFPVVGLLTLMLTPATAMAEGSTTTNELAAVAQSKTVKGHVVDEFGEPMIGVTVKVADGNQLAGAITDLDGNFVLTVPAGKQRITFEYIGYRKKTVSADSPQLEVKMEPDAVGLDDVLVIGYGTVRKRDMLGAISQVGSEDIKKAPVMNAMEGLSGKIAGLDIVRESGQAGSAPQLLLRGNRSLTSNCAPLFIIDGVPGDIDNLNPNDIENIEVLKDAASTAVYGAEGANGVVIVTTRQGQVGKTQVDFNAYIGINAFPSYPETLQGQDWLNFITEGYRARYDKEPDSIEELFSSAGLSDGALEAYKNNQWINWRDEILHTGVQQNYNISVRGGSEHMQSYMSAGYQQEKGLYENDKFDKLTFRAGTTYKINDIVSVGFQSTLTYQNKEARNSRLSKSLNQLSLGQVRNEDGSLKLKPIDDMTDYVNILADDAPYAYKRNAKSTYINVAPFVEIRPLKGLSFKSLLNASISNSRTGVYDGLNTYMELTGSQSPNQRSANYNTGNGWSYMWQNILSYNININKQHDIALTGVIEYGKSRSETSGSSSEQIEFDEFLYYNLGAGYNQKVDTDYRETSKLSYILRGSYSFLGRYLLSASVRWDGASVLHKDHRWHAFPAVSVGWRISDEPFMEKTKNWLDNLKLRIGYGVTGNSNIGPYTSVQLVEPSATHVTLGDTDIIPYKLTKYVTSPDLTWETSYNWNFGLDFAFLGGRIDGSLEYYTTDTKNVLYERPVPTTNGLYNAKEPYVRNSNIARISNRGFELTLNTRNIVKKNFTWSSTLTFATNKERLKEINLGNNVAVDELVALNLFIDQPVNTFYGYKKLGIWQYGEEEQAAAFGNQVGTVKVDVPRLVWDPNYTYELLDDDGNPSGEFKTGAYYIPGEVDDDGNQVYYNRNNTYTINANTDRQILGSKTPDWSLGFQNQFTFYNFDLSIMMNMRWGQVINGELLSYVSNKNQPACYDYWTPSNPTNAYPRPIQGYSMTTAQKESMYYVNGSFFKIKNITLGYTFPKSILRKLSLTKLRVYGTITNPLIIAKEHNLLKGMDPESNASDKFPLYKTLVFGLNVSF